MLPPRSDPTPWGSVLIVALTLVALFLPPLIEILAPLFRRPPDADD